MATFVPAKRATQFIFYGGVASQANTKILQANPTIAAGDFKVSIDGGALANLGTLPTVTPAAGKMIKFTLSVAEMTGDNITVVGSDVAGAEWCDFIQNFQTAARQIDDLAFPATSGRSMVVDAAGLVDSNAVKVGPTGAGTAQTAGDVIGDTNDIQARLPAALVGGRMDSSVGAMAANVQTAASTAADFVTELQSGLATSAALATVQADTDNIQTRLPAALVGGRMDSSVEAMAANVMTSAATAADYVTELQSGLSTAAALAVVQADTDNIQTRLPAALVAGKIDASLDAAGLQTDAVNEIRDSIFAQVIEGAFSFIQYTRIMGSVLLGKLSGAATATNSFRDTSDTKNRVVATVDPVGNRTAISYDGT